jgi:hypothetical protein
MIGIGFGRGDGVLLTFGFAAIFYKTYFHFCLLKPIKRWAANCTIIVIDLLTT